MNNRDMFYNSYGFNNGMMPNQMYQPNMMPCPNQFNEFGDLEDRVNKIEKQINRLNERLKRLESSHNNYNNQDDNLYMI